jgi:hypothetical protein
MVRLLVMLACGTRTFIDAVFGTDRVGETTYAHHSWAALEVEQVGDGEEADPALPTARLCLTGMAVRRVGLGQRHQRLRSSRRVTAPAPAVVPSSTNRSPRWTP